jgi:ABC-type antimicrobial peptide transport system ATPase subunit
MSDSPSQSYASHRRFDPPYHFVLFGVLAANFVMALWALIRMFIKQPFDFGVVWAAAMAAILVLFALKVRLYALHNQDRLIQLEETLRMQSLLPDNLKARIPELRVSQFVALRFASDAELAGLVEAALDEKLGNADIKKRIRTWRPDTFRV